MEIPAMSPPKMGPKNSGAEILPLKGLSEKRPARKYLERLIDETIVGINGMLYN